MSEKNDELGNPLVVASALQMAQNPGVQKAGKVIVVTGVAATAVYFGNRYRKKLRQNRLLKKAGTDPEVQTAINIYSSIPAGLKKDTVSFFNPAGLIADVGNDIARIWQSTDTERILKIAKGINDNKLSLKKIYKHFYNIYGEHLYPLLQKAMKSEDLIKFSNVSKSGSVSVTAATKKASYAFVKVSGGVVIREKPDVPNWALKQAGYNKIGIVPYGKIAGIATGNEVYNKEDDVVFVELTVFDTKGKKHRAYAWKGAFSFHTEKVSAKMYRYPTNEFSGFDPSKKLPEHIGPTEKTPAWVKDIWDV